MDFQTFFKVAMDRSIHPIYHNTLDISLNLGAGNKHIPGNNSA